MVAQYRTSTRATDVPYTPCRYHNKKNLDQLFPSPGVGPVPIDLPLQSGWL